MASLRDTYVKRRIPNFVNGAKVRTHSKSVKDLEPDELDYYQQGRNEPTPPDANYVSAVKQRKKPAIVIYEVAVDEEKQLEKTSKNLAAMFNCAKPIQSPSIPMAHDHKELLVRMGVGFTSEGVVDVDTIWNEETVDTKEKVAKPKRSGKEHRVAFEEKAEERNGNSRTEVGVGSGPAEAMASSAYSNDSTLRRRPFRQQRLDKEAERFQLSLPLEASIEIASPIISTGPVLCSRVLREQRRKREAERQTAASQSEDTSSSSKEVSPNSTYSIPAVPSRPFRAQRLKEEAERQNSSNPSEGTSFASSSTIANLSGMDVSLDGIEETSAGKVIKSPNIETITEDGQWENVSSDFTGRNPEVAFVDLKSLISDNWGSVPSEKEEGAQRVDQWNPEPVGSAAGVTRLREPNIFRSHHVQHGPSRASTPKAKQAAPDAEEEWEQVTSDFTKQNSGPAVKNKTLAADDTWGPTTADLVQNTAGKTTDQWNTTDTYDAFAGYYEPVSVSSPEVKPGPSRPPTSNKGKSTQEPKSTAAPKPEIPVEEEWEQVTSDFTKQNPEPVVVNKTSTNGDWELRGTTEEVVPEPTVDANTSRKKDSRFKIPLFTVPSLAGDPDKFATAVVKRAKNKNDIILVCVDNDVEEAIIRLQSEMQKEYENDTVDSKLEFRLKEGRHYGLRTVDSKGIVRYYRVQLLLLAVDKKAFVFCCDTGSEKMVPRSDLFQLRPEWTKVPQRAVYAQMFPGSEDKAIGTLEKDESFRAQHIMKTYQIETLFTGNVRKYAAGTPMAKVPRALVEFKQF